MWLQLRMYMLLGAMFALIYAILVVAASYMGVGGFLVYAVLASVILLVQYMVGPKMIEITMGVKYVSREEEPELHEIVEELARRAGMKKPRIGVSNIQVPNAFAFGRSRSDGRVCVTKGIMNLLDKDELKAVIGHEICHIKNRDVTVITMLSIVPMICWYMAWSFMFSRRRRGNTVLLGIGAFVLYFITNLLVLYGSRIREYYADRGSVALGNPPHALASALYKLVYGSAKVPKDSLKKMEGYKAFFVNDPSRAWKEVNELKEIDTDMSGTIDSNELAAIRTKKVKVGRTDKFMEILSTHPNMLKRIGHLSDMA